MVMVLCTVLFEGRGDIDQVILSDVHFYYRTYKKRMDVSNFHLFRLSLLMAL